MQTHAQASKKANIMMLNCGRRYKESDGVRHGERYGGRTDSWAHHERPMHAGGGGGRGVTEHHGKILECGCEARTDMVIWSVMYRRMVTALMARSNAMFLVW